MKYGSRNTAIDTVPLRSLRQWPALLQAALGFLNKRLYRQARGLAETGRRYPAPWRTPLLHLWNRLSSFPRKMLPMMNTVPLLCRQQRTNQQQLIPSMQPSLPQSTFQTALVNRIAQYLPQSSYQVFRRNLQYPSRVLYQLRTILHPFHRP